MDQPHLVDFEAFQRARTQHLPRILDVVAGDFRRSLDRDMLSYENTLCILL